MEWNVWRLDERSREIVSWNIFNHSRFLEDAMTHLRICEDKISFSTSLRYDLMYYFWAKAEYEILLNPWVIEGKTLKVDIYKQVMLNWDVFVDYVWSFKKGD